MKKIRIIVLSLICSFSAMGQIKIKTEQVEITLPTGVQRVNKPQSISNNDGTVTMVMGGEYKYEDQFLNINYGQVSENPNFLNEIKTAIENRRKKSNAKDDYYQSTMERFNGNFGLITRNKGVGYDYFLFYITNKACTYSVRGTLQFLANEELKAKGYLDEILKSVIIKN